jgi:hypothetical protein
VSVLKNKRKESPMKVIALGDEIVAYTLRLLFNENVFPKKSRWLMSGKIADLMNEFHKDLHKANDTYVVTPEDAKERHVLQTRAYATLNASASVMRMAQLVLQFDVNRLEHWAGMCVEELRLLKAWQRNDDRRYSITKE